MNVTVLKTIAPQEICKGDVIRFLPVTGKRPIVAEVREEPTDYGSFVSITCSRVIKDPHGTYLMKRRFDTVHHPVELLAVDGGDPYA